MFATSLPAAQLLERATGVRKVMGSIPVGDSDFFFVPCSRHVEYSIFVISSPSLKFTILLYLSFFVCSFFSTQNTIQLAEFCHQNPSSSFQRSFPSVQSSPLGRIENLRHGHESPQLKACSFYD